MEQIPTLYTYGNIHIKAEELIAQLTPFGINCVVDCCFFTPDGGIMLVSINPAYEPMYYSKKRIRDEGVEIIGKVVELRAKVG